MFTALDNVRKTFRDYPEKRPGQTYRRTFRFKRSWKIRRLGDTGWRISNTARFRGRAYPQFVMGDAQGRGQAWMHKRRWPVFRDEVEREFSKVPASIWKHLRPTARRAGFT